MSLLLPVREDLAGLEPYDAPQLNVPVRLNVNENPYALSPKVITGITRSTAKAAPALNRYPDRDFTGLRYTLADYLEVGSGVRRVPELIWTANGSNEIMTQILQAFEGPRRTLVPFALAYSMYHEYARNTNTTWVQGGCLDDFSLDLDAVTRVLARERPAVLVLANPSNPTGMALPQKQQQTIIGMTHESGPIINGCPSATLVIIDRTYGGFRREGVPSTLELLKDALRLVVTRTMSKTFGMIGLHLGYTSAAREIIDAVMLVYPSYHLPALTQVAALAVLRYKDSLIVQVGALRKERGDLVDWLRTHGFYTLNSDANFVLFSTFEDHTAVFETLFARGVLIRVVGPEGWLRVSVGTPEKTRLFITALEKITRWASFSMPPASPSLTAPPQSPRSTWK